MKVYYKITGMFLLALIVIQLTGINCIDSNDIPFSDDVDQSIALIHAGEPTSIDNAANHSDEGGYRLHDCPCHFQFIPNPVLVKTETTTEVVQRVPSYNQYISLLPERISKPPRLI